MSGEGQTQTGAVGTPPDASDEPWRDGVGVPGEAGITIADLRPIDLFDDLSDEELEPWAAVARERLGAPGDIISEQGRRAAGVHFLLEGTARSLIHSPGGRVEPVGHQRAPTWMGAIGSLTHGPVSVRMQAETPSRFAFIPAADFERLTLADQRIHARVMSVVSPVVTRITTIEQNRERLAALGTMSAGLAHELNNPAAAAQRAAAELAGALDVLASTIGEFVESGIERSQAEELVQLQREAIARAAERGSLDALDAADAEEDLLEALQDLGISEPWKLAEPLAGAGLDRDWLARVTSLAGNASEAAIEWVAASLDARGLVDELRAATDQMSRLVGAVKAYSYMDRGELVEADVHEGLETTLIVLGHKLKHTHINIVRDYDRSLPLIMMHGSELNQVWTNLLDNAIDALGDEGTITLRTSRDTDCILVQVTDDGPGMSPEVAARAFEPFFTTKGVGQGTGLGLDTAQRIVVERHRGTIKVESEPGETTFSVWLPLGAEGAGPGGDVA